MPVKLNSSLFMQYCFKNTVRGQRPLPVLAALFLIIYSTLFSAVAFGQIKSSNIIQMVYTSDAHYGITRKKFRGDTNVSGHTVNAAMIRQINAMPGLTLPADSGIGASKQVGAIDYVIETGDIANRMEIPVQTAAVSWGQFEQDYLHGVKLRGQSGLPAKLLLAPGNHDISNAIGFPKPMSPLTDPTSMVKIYNLMLKPKTLLTNETYNYDKDKVNYSFNLKGIHMMFITLWPDSAERIWMQKDLDTVKQSTPVIIFTHDQPTCEAKHFTDPLQQDKLIFKNNFENLVVERYKERYKATKDDGVTDIEQRGFVKFLKSHPNIKAYFHGNSNWNEFYTYKGPDNDVNLKVFRVDSPMKGKFSSVDEKKLSFQLITLDTENKLLTVRECLWNTVPSNTNAKTIIGKNITVSLNAN
ncbi:MAG TPA: hypothetical protein VGN20_07370 [Mucilaginibacter sp.]|jgi:hypothetical protein